MVEGDPRAGERQLFADLFEDLLAVGAEGEEVVEHQARQLLPDVEVAALQGLVQLSGQMHPGHRSPCRTGLL